MAAGVDSRHFFEDHASGAKDDRPGLAYAVAFVGPSDVLVVWKLDRLGRSLSHLLSIVNALKEKHVAFRSLTEGMDTTEPSGELLFHVFGALVLRGQSTRFDFLLSLAEDVPAPGLFRDIG